MATDPEGETSRPVAGHVLFALGFFAFSAFLLSRIGSETRWIDSAKFAAQPRLWPAVGLIGMVGFGALHWLTLPRRGISDEDYAEARRWLGVFEWVGWFIVYVWLVPIVGYLPVTVLFVVILSWRLGYRGLRWTVISALFGAAVVIGFKAFLSVKIPGALLYEYLPDAMRNFFIINL